MRHTGVGTWPRPLLSFLKQAKPRYVSVAMVTIIRDLEYKPFRIPPTELCRKYIYARIVLGYCLKRDLDAVFMYFL